jgi:integrase
MSFVVHGRQERKTTGTENKRRAEVIYGKTLADIEEERFFDKPKNIKMVEVIEKFMNEVSPSKQGSHERNKQIVEHFKIFFGDVLLGDVRPALLSRYKTERLLTITKRGGSISPDTVRKELSLLRQIFNIAIAEWELCRDNPVRKIIRSLTREEKRVRYVFPEEAEKLRFTIPAWLKPLIITACQTGLRRGDLLNLTIRQVNFDSKRIVIEKTKNGDPVGLEMTSIVCETLLNLIRERIVVSPYVFCDARGKAYSPYKVSMAFRRACERAEVTNLRFHDLRHDFATLMLSKTRNLIDVQRSLGHRDPRMSLRYAHLLPGDLKGAFEAIDNTGTASILSQFYHNGEKEKVCNAVNP